MHAYHVVSTRKSSNIDVIKSLSNLHMTLKTNVNLYKRMEMFEDYDKITKNLTFYYMNIAGIVIFGSYKEIHFKGF